MNKQNCFTVPFLAVGNWQPVDIADQRSGFHYILCPCLEKTVGFEESMFGSDQQKMKSKIFSGFPKKTFLMVSQLPFQDNSFLNCFNAETITEYIDVVTDSLNRIQRLIEPIRLQPPARQQERIDQSPSVNARHFTYRCSDNRRRTRRPHYFETPGKLMAFIGLIPSEHSSGAKVKKGPVLDTFSDFRRSILDRERKCWLASAVSTLSKRALSGYTGIFQSPLSIKILLIQKSPAMELTGIITAILSALFMGTVGVFAKITGLGPETITLFRLLLGSVFMLGFLLGTGQLRRVARWPSWPTLINGAMLAGFIIFYVQAMTLTTMANAIMLVYLAPLTASIYAHFFLGEHLNRLSAGLIGLALFGFAMMMEFKIDSNGASNHLAGIGFGLLSMLCYTAFILINRAIDDHIHVYTRTFYQLLAGGLIMLPLCLLSRPELPMQTWPWLAAIGMVPGFLAILCAVIALSRLPAATFGTLAYIEPIAVIIFGWVLFDEALSPLQIGGCLLIVTSGVLKTWSSVNAPAIPVKTDTNNFS